MELKDLIRKYRPNIKEITINNYIKYKYKKPILYQDMGL